MKILIIIYAIIFMMFALSTISITLQNIDEFKQSFQRFPELKKTWFLNKTWKHHTGSIVGFNLKTYGYENLSVYVDNKWRSFFSTRTNGEHGSLCFLFSMFKMVQILKTMVIIPLIVFACYVVYKGLIILCF